MKFYNYRNIDKTEATYRLIIGERSNGKTFGYLKKVLQEFVKTGLPSAYIRRYDVDIRAAKMQRLFGGIVDSGEFKKIVRGKWDNIYYYGGVFYARKMDGEKCIEKKPILYVYALNVWEHSKGADIGEVKYICFDEFCTRGKYLTDEFIALHQTISSIVRNRRGVIIYLLANTVNKFCPHFEEFGIGDIDKIKQGSIIDYKNGVALEYCESTGNASKTEYLKPFDNVQLDMLRSGAWEQAQYPHISKSNAGDSIEFYFYIVFSHKTLCGEIRQTDSGGLYIFFRHQTKDIKKHDAVIYSQDVSTDALHSTSLTKYQPTKIHQIIYQLIRANKILYQSNEVGEIVRNWLLWQGVTLS